MNELAQKSHGYFGWLLALLVMRHIMYQKSGLKSAKGKFDQGWDKIREEILERQKRLGVVPEKHGVVSAK